MTSTGKLGLKVISLAIVAVATSLVLVSFALAARDGKSYPSNVSVAGISVADLNRDGARELLEKSLVSKNGDRLLLKFHGKNMAIPLEEIGIKYDIESTLDQIDNSLYNEEADVQILQHSLLRGKKQEISPVFNWEKEKIYQKLLDIKQDNDQAAVDARILYNNDYLEYRAHKNGYVININSSLNKISASLNKGFIGPIELDFTEISPRVKIEDIENVKDILGVSACNIKATPDEEKTLLEKWNGLIIMPGESFSLSGSKDRLLAQDIDLKQKLEDIIYKVCSEAGMEIRKNSGEVANPFEHPVLLTFSFEEKTLLVKIFGCQTVPGKEIKLVNEKEEVIPEVQIKVDRQLNAQQRVVKQEGKSGLLERTYRVVSNGGKVVEKGLLSEQYLPPSDTVILVGPGSIRK